MMRYIFRSTPWRTRGFSFLIGPIGPSRSEDRAHADRLLKLIVRPTFSTHFKQFKVERADQISRPGMIDSQAISLLIDADLVIADLTLRNANTFYELGIRHFIQKPVIHLFRRGEPIPFDIQPYRAIEFGYSEKIDIRDAKIALRKAVSDVLSPDFHIENPVTRSRAMTRLQQQISEPRKDLMVMAHATQVPIAHLLGHLEVQQNKTGLIQLRPDLVAGYINDIHRSRELAETLYEAIQKLNF